MPFPSHPVRAAVTAVRRACARPLESHNPFWLGVVAVTVLTALTALTVVIGRLGVGQVGYEAEFAQAAQLSAGDQVSAAGVPIGTVKSVRLEGDRVVVGMRIDGDVTLGADTRAEIKLTTLLGSRYVEVKPAGTGSIADHRIRLAHTAVPYDLQTALQNATSTFEQVDADKIARSMTVLTRQLEGVPRLVPEVLRNIENLSAVIADRRGQIGTLLASTAELTTALRDQQVTLGQMVVRGQSLVSELLTRVSALRRLIAATTGLVGRLQHLVGDRQPQVVGLIDDLDQLVGALAAREDVLRNTLQILPVPLRNFANATGSANDLDFGSPSGILIDSWMCALSGRAEMMSLARYFKDCK